MNLQHILLKITRSKPTQTLGFGTGSMERVKCHGMTAIKKGLKYKP